jgi:hypothetical protein
LSNKFIPRTKSNFAYSEEMTKILILLAVVLTLCSCGKKDDSSSSSSPEAIPQYIGLNNKVITIEGEEHAPMDFLSQKLIMTFNSVTQKVTAKSIIKFRLFDSGRPYFELQAQIKSLHLDKESTVAASITDPDGQNQNYWSVNEELRAGVVHEMEVEYELPVGRVSFVNGGVRFLTDMTDLSGKFFEYWGPTGFEEDAFTLDLELKVVESASTHKLYTNGEIISSDSSVWKITFPDYYSKSSFYIHLTNQTLPVKKFVYQGIEKDIPVEVYGLSSSLVDSAVAQLPKLFKELEADYGAYPHEKFLAYMNDRSGGMEYVAATITSLGSLDHELLHSWFARGVIPADGRSGWIDEAIASWRDYGYIRATSTLNRTPTNLANYSPFRKTTPRNSYVDGRGLMAELDKKFASLGGMKPLLKELQRKFKNQIISNDAFWEFLENETGIDVMAFKTRYAMGGVSPEMPLVMKTHKSESIPLESQSKHPTPLTEEEILRLR